MSVTWVGEDDLKRARADLVEIEKMQSALRDVQYLSENERDASILPVTIEVAARKWRRQHKIDPNPVVGDAIKSQLQMELIEKCGPLAARLRVLANRIEAMGNCVHGDLDGRRE